MKVTWNGTGAAWSTAFGNSSAVVEAEGYRLLIDCGHTVPSRLQKMNLSLQDIDAVFVSHMHGDHVYGLEEWGFKSALLWKIKPYLLVPAGLSARLWQNILMGTMGQVGDRTWTLRDYFDLHLAHVGKPVAVGPFSVSIYPVEHVPFAHAYGIKVRVNDVAVAFTCDTRFPASDWFYEDTAAVFHDCSFLPCHPGTVHAHFEQISTYPLAYRKKTFLVHYDDSICEKRADPEWMSALASTSLRLAEPFVPLTFGVCPDEESALPDSPDSE